ncbi:MAG: glutamate--tRNA ligase [Acidobacteria bacterium]|nr:glutamate--tRNA ligase [Acidobacteriota bacterium]
MRVRFAPSPTGQLHVGNARTALFNWLLARRHGGRFILRIEDTDVERSTRESEAGILRDLRWLGLDWDEGPDIGGKRGPYRQSERLHLYESYARELLASGQGYHCFCSIAQLDAERQAALAAGRPARYSGACRTIPRDRAEARIAAGERPAIRFRVPEGREIIFDDAVRGTVRFQTDVIGDPVIVRADGTPAYNFAVVVDDALMEVTHVIRGEDHISNTPRQLLLYEALGFNPPVFAHLSLVMGPDHSPLSKRHGATAVAEFRARGYLPEALVNYLALIGWSPGGGDELLAIDDLARRFSLEQVGLSAGVFDEEKLAWVNRHYLKMADARRLAELAVPFFNQAGIVMAPAGRGVEFLAAAMPMAAASVDRLDQVPRRLAFLFDYSPEAALAGPGVRDEMQGASARGVVAALAEALESAPRLDRERFRAVAGALKMRTGQKGRALFHPIRVALTGRAEGPELDLALPAIDLGAELPNNAGVPPVLGCRERAAAFVEVLRS